MSPTPEDLARNLTTDLDSLTREPWGSRICVCVYAQRGWPAAIRRALAAEAEVAELRAEVERLRKAWGPGDTD